MATYTKQLACNFGTANSMQAVTYTVTSADGTARITSTAIGNTDAYGLAYASATLDTAWGAGRIEYLCNNKKACEDFGATALGPIVTQGGTLANTTNITAATGVIVAGGTLNALTGTVNVAGGTIGSVTNPVTLASSQTFTNTNSANQTGDAYAIVNNGTYGNSALKVISSSTNAVLETIASGANVVRAYDANGNDLATSTQVGGLITTVGTAGAGLTAIPHTWYTAAPSASDNATAAAAAILALPVNKLLTDADGKVTSNNATPFPDDPPTGWTDVLAKEANATANTAAIEEAIGAIPTPSAARVIVNPLPVSSTGEPVEAIIVRWAFAYVITGSAYAVTITTRDATTGALLDLQAVPAWGSIDTLTPGIVRTDTGATVTPDGPFVRAGLGTYTSSWTAPAAGLPYRVTVNGTFADGQMQQGWNIVGASTAPSAGQCSVSFLVVSGSGNPMSGVECSFTCTAAPSGTGLVVVGQSVSVASDTGGNVAVNLVQGATYTGQCGSGPAFTLEVPTSSTQSMPNQLGA